MWAITIDHVLSIIEHVLSKTCFLVSVMSSEGQIRAGCADAWPLEHFPC